MKRLKLVLKAVVESRASAIGKLLLPGEAVVIERGVPRWILIKCPCGCGEEIPINVDARSGKAWRLYRDNRSGITLYPSVWRDTGCESHFIVWRGQINLFGSSADDERSPMENAEVSALAERVLHVWPKNGLAPYLPIADQLGEIPWDILEACRWLVRKGILVEGLGRDRGSFRRRV